MEKKVTRKSNRFHNFICTSNVMLLNFRIYHIHCIGSRFSEKRLRSAYERLKKRGIPLASNQVNYSLIYRAPEQTGVKAACDELGVTLIAYSPIAQGDFPLSPLLCGPSFSGKIA